MRDLGMLESALGQPRQTFGGEDLYPSLTSKAAALGFSLIMNHPFIDGNKRVGRAAESQRRSMKEGVKSGLRPGWMRSRVALGTQPLGWIIRIVRERCAG